MSSALLLVGHGSRDAESDDVLPYYVEELRRSGVYSEVRACYLEKSPGIRDALAEVRSKRVVVMPLLLASGYHTRVTIPEALGLTPTGGPVHGKEIVLLEPLGRSEHIVRLIEDRVSRVNAAGVEHS